MVLQLEKERKKKDYHGEKGVQATYGIKEKGLGGSLNCSSSNRGSSLRGRQRERSGGNNYGGCMSSLAQNNAGINPARIRTIRAIYCCGQLDLRGHTLYVVNWSTQI